MNAPNAVVIRAPGTNCDLETACAFEMAGAHTDIVHVNALYRGEKSLEEYQILAIPGGFSYGDDISAAVVWANELKHRLRKDLTAFVEAGKPVVGICNGFQVLVKAGLLPAFDHTIEKQSVTLAFNDIGLYFDTWVFLKHGKSPCLFTKSIDRLLNLPVAHAEGKFVAESQVLARLEERSQAVFTYADEKGEDAGFPWNPNGSLHNIAGICNPAGNVMGLMPHPERYLHKYMHPHWTCKSLDEVGDGFTIFKNAVNYTQQRF